MNSLVATALLALSAASPIIPTAEHSEFTKRDSSFAVYGEGQDVAIDAPGVAYHPAYKGFPSRGVGPSHSNFISALVLNFFHPGWVPTGVNPAQCTPKEGQPPVVLIPGTSETAYANWAYMGPNLAQEGLCVYSFNHAPLTLNGKEVAGTGFFGNITDSAYALSTFVDEVLALTGASQVDFVGHSQGGGALPFYYLKNIMTGNKVRKQIGLAPSLGTNILGMNTLVDFVLSHEEANAANQLISAASNAASLAQQLIDSDWMQALHKGGLAVDGVEYVNLATKYDDVLIPYTNCNFEESGKKITNIVLQDVCDADKSDHLGLSYSSNVYQIVKNHLFNTNNPIECRFQLPVIN